MFLLMFCNIKIKFKILIHSFYSSTTTGKILSSSSSLAKLGRGRRSIPPECGREENKLWYCLGMAKELHKSFKSLHFASEIGLVPMFNNFKLFWLNCLRLKPNTPFQRSISKCSCSKYTVYNMLYGLDESNLLEQIFVKYIWHPSW